MPQRFLHLDTGEQETTESFFSNLLLRGRIKGGLESNQGLDPLFDEGRSPEWLESHWREIRDNEMRYDEDVNQYLTLTLAELANPRCLQHINACLVDLDSDAGRRALEEEETFKRYYLYKINADFLLFHLGLFCSETHQPRDAYFDKGGAYYYSAASSLKGIKRGRSALSDVLEKLSQCFPRYVEILRVMKRNADNYLSFHFRISAAEIKQLEHALTLAVRERRNPETGFQN